jgi:hypothetical protein
MAQNEPEIPVIDGDLPQDPADIAAKTDPEKGKPNADKSGTDDADKSKENLTVSKDQYDQLVEGWKEDRDYYQGEIKRLRTEVNSPTFTKQEEDELADIDDPDERAEKRFEFKQKRKEAVEKAELEVVRSEIRFLKRTDSEFRDNEKAIIKVASDYDCKNLNQAVLIWRGLNKDKAAKDKEYNDERKKGADGKGGGNAGGKPVGNAAPAPKPGQKKSFSDMYAEGLGK